MMFRNNFSIRYDFLDLYRNEKFVIDKSGCKMIEILNASFIAIQDSIFGKVNKDYIERELEWYKIQSLYVEDIPGETPKIWKDISDRGGKINSNYGYLVYSEDNYLQFDNVVNELAKNPDSRRAEMIYTRPSIWKEFDKDGMSDFICTETVQYLIRDNKLNTIVKMRSNDAWAGYRNDYAWQKHVRNQVYWALKHFYNNLQKGDIYWNVGSLHLYERQFYLLDYFDKTYQWDITKKEYEIWKQKN
jgi:thymidylate synthase